MPTFRFSGNPIAWKRPRTSRGRFYDAQVDDKRKYQIELYSQSPGFNPYCGPLEVELEFGMPIPSSWSAKRKTEAIGQPHTSTPDLSNMVKFIEDALNEHCWSDDKQIVKLSARKVYKSEPGTKLWVNPI